MHELLLNVDNVTAGYAQDIDVLREVSLAVHAGQVSGLIGLNGAGKSTVIKTICGFLAPKAGRIEYLGESINGIDPHHLIDRDICCIPQESSLFPYLTVEENLLLPLQGRARKFAAVLAQRFEEVQRIFPALKARRRAQAGDLSGGQQKQLEFAKAWLQHPRLCLIDEPSIGLAPILAEEVFRWIERFAQSGMGILLIDHNVRRVVKMSDRIHVLSLGRITAAGGREEFEGDLHEQVRQWLGLDF
jgi:ABC-type branched-subunit amino acid transport system ATPase component